MRKSINPYQGPRGPAGPEFNTSKIRPRAQIRTGISRPKINPNIRPGSIRSTRPNTAAATTTNTLLFTTAAPMNWQFRNNAKCKGDTPVCDGIATYANPTGPSGTTWPWIRKQNCSLSSGGSNACGYGVPVASTGGLSNTIFPPIAGVYPSVIDPYPNSNTTQCPDTPYCDSVYFVVTYNNVDPTQLTDSDLAIFQANLPFPGYMMIPPPGPITTLGSGTIYQPSQFDSYNSFILPNLCAQVDTNPSNCPVDPYGGGNTPCSRFVSTAFNTCNSFYTEYVNGQISNAAMAATDTAMGGYCSVPANANNVDCDCVNVDNNPAYKAIQAAYPNGIPWNNGCFFLPCKDSTHFLIPENNLNPSCPSCAVICDQIINEAGSNANNIINNQSITCSGANCPGWVPPSPTGPCPCPNGCTGYLNSDNTCNCSECPTGPFGSCTGPNGCSGVYNSFGICVCSGSCTGPNGCSGVYNSSGICVCSGTVSFWDKYKYYIIGGIVIFIILIIILISVFAYSKKKKNEEEEMRTRKNARMRKIT